jgi:carbon monoxide dehydrogenase subunit G
MKTTTRLAGSLLLAPALMLADFTYTEITKITGGALMNMSRALGGFSKDLKKVGEPTISTVYLKGNRMATVNDQNAHIVDLDQETMTDVDFVKKTYTTITFAQMREAMERAMKQSQGRVSEAKQKQKETETKAESNTEVNWRVDVKETGKIQNFGGVNTKEVVMTMIIEGKDKKTGQSGEMQTMMSIWLADKVAGYDELEDFNKRFAMKMASVYGSLAMGGPAMAMAGDPRFRDSMGKMAKEAEKLKGVQIRQVTKMGTNLDPSKAGEVTDPSTMPEGPTAGEAASRGAQSGAERQAVGRLGRALPGGLGGLGGFGRRKKEQPQEAPANPPAQNQSAQQSGILMEMLMEKSNFATSGVDASKLGVPSGFQQVEHPMLKR